MLISSLSPGVFIILGSLVCVLLPKTVRNYGIVALSIWNLIQMIQLKVGVAVNGEFAPGISLNLMTTDRLSWIFGFVFSILWLASAIYSIFVEKRHELLAINIYLGSAMGIVFAGNLIAVVFFWELMAIASMCTILMGGAELSRRAGFRYLIAHFIGGNLLLAGVVIKMIQGYNDVASVANSPHDAAFWMILAGVLLNAAMPPLHAWLTDSYTEATVAGAVLLSGCTTKVAVYCLIRMFPGSSILVIIGVFAAVFGVVYALFENDMRRLLSYHIISQVGFMTASVGLGTELALDGAAALAFTHIIYKSLLFMCIGAIIYATGKRRITELGGLYKKMPFEMVCFIIASLSISGLPLFSGFTSKSMILAAAAESGNTWMELLLVLAGIGTFISITLKMTYFIFFGKCDDAFCGREAAENECSSVPETNNGDSAYEINSAQTGADRLMMRRVPVSMKIAMGAEAFLCIYYGIRPNALFGILPGMSETPLYNMDHLTEYGEMIAMAVLVFALFLPRMKPHNLLSLDIDWLYRKPIFRLMSLSEAACRMEEGVRNALKTALKVIIRYSRNPVFFTRRAEKSTDRAEKKIQRSYEPDAYRITAGTLIMINIGALVVILAFLFYTVR